MFLSGISLLHFHLLSLLKDPVGWSSCHKHVFHQTEAVLYWALSFWLLLLPLEELRNMNFEHALRIFVRSIWKTLTSRGRQRAWRSVPWKCSTHFKWPWSHTCLSTNIALIQGKRDTKELILETEHHFSTRPGGWHAFSTATEIQSGCEWW